MSAAALRPGHGHPQALYIQGTHSGSCNFTPLDVRPNGRARTDRGVIEYRPEPEVGGVIRGYTLALFPQGGGAPMEMDHLGQVNALPIPTVAPTLDAVESARPAQALKEQGLDARRSELTAVCQSGDLAVCEDLGDFEWNYDQPRQAARWWEYACERGRLQSCLLTSTYNPSPNSNEASVDKKRCAEGDKRYCDKLAELVRVLTPYIEERRRPHAVQAPVPAPEGAAAQPQSRIGYAGE